MAKRRYLTIDELTALDEDIIRRLQLQRPMAANTYAVLELELGISERTIRNIETGNHQFLCPYKVSAAVRHQVRIRRGAWHLGNEAIQAFSVLALAEKYGKSHRTIENRIRLVRYSDLYQNRQEARAA